MTAPREAREETAQKQRVDLRALLDQFENDLADLRVKFEQYFTGMAPLPPDKPLNDLKRLIRNLRKAPFKNSAHSYRLRSLENRYNTLHTYWQRVLREREEGRYIKDVFKAEMRERHQKEDKFALTKKGISEKGIQQLFHTYRDALERQTGKAHDLDYDAFHQSILNRVKSLKEQHEGKKFSFKVVVQEGKVSLKAKIKDK